jgi:DnaK suppressor protein
MRLVQKDMKKATTADILGFCSRPRIPERWSQHHHSLCAIRDQLQTIQAPRIVSERTDDIADAGAAELDDNLELTVHHATRETLGEVMAALRRIERGTYGTCELTGEPIEPERLEATPWARYSLAGQSQLEEVTVNTHARLGNRQNLAFLESDSEGGEGFEIEETSSAVAA